MSFKPSVSARYGASGCKAPYKGLLLHSLVPWSTKAIGLYLPPRLVLPDLETPVYNGHCDELVASTNGTLDEQDGRCNPTQNHHHQLHVETNPLTQQ